MTTRDGIELRPDLHAVHMKAAADARGLPNFYRKSWENTKWQAHETWLQFAVKQKTYYYSTGILVEAGVDKWDPVGRNVNHKAAVLVTDKFRAKNYLKDRGFSVPEGKFFRRRHLDKAIDFFDSLDKPLCVKPNKGSEGRNVFPAIYERKWYEYALRKVAEAKPNIVVEESVSGEHFRFFYVYPKMVGVRHGVRLHVVGDGVTSINGLLEAKNELRRQRNLPTHPPYAIDEPLLDFLAMQNLTLEDIPAAGQTVYLLGVSNGTAGADTHVLDLKDVHSSYCRIVEQVCQSIPGLHFSGVDLVIQDISQPATRENHWILEVNTNPAITGFYYPWQGEVVDVAGYILDFLMTDPDFS